MSGVYTFPAVQTDVIGVLTNKFPTDAIRGAGRPEATHMIEVTMDQIAHELGMDPLELRRQNFIPPHNEPHETAIGVMYDSGNHEGTLDKLMEHVDVAGFRAEQERLRSEGVYRGIGFCTYTEVCGVAPARVFGPGGFGVQGGGWESGMVRVNTNGSVTVYTGTSPHGQGHETGFAQIVADRLGVDPQEVEVIHGDTATGPEGLDTYGSRTLAVGGEAVARATEKVVAEGEGDRRAPAGGGAGGHRGPRRQVPGQGLAGQGACSLAEIAGEAYIPLNLPEGMEPGLEETAFYDPENFVFPFGAHACFVDVDAGHRQGQGRAVRRGRRLRPGDQPDAHRRPGPRRHRAVDRPGAVRAGRLRRRRPARHRHVRRLRAADGATRSRRSRPTARRPRRRRTRSA